MCHLEIFFSAVCIVSQYSDAYKNPGECLGGRLGVEKNESKRFREERYSGKETFGFPRHKYFYILKITVKQERAT